MTTESSVTPKAGKLIVFSAGMENPHRVNIVESGTRFVLSFWFTCDERLMFDNFLDGSAHQHFGNIAEKEKEEAATAKVSSDAPVVYKGGKAAVRKERIEREKKEKEEAEL